MNDTDIIIKALASHGSAIAKIVFPRIPEQALQTLITLGIKNKMSDPKIKSVIDFLFDSDGNLPSPQEFWEVFKSVLDDKPITFNIFNKQLRINGDDINEVKALYENSK